MTNPIPRPVGATVSPRGERSSWLRRTLRLSQLDGDLVADTPNQAGGSPFSSTSCRTFPSISCMNGPNGDMFMNYMDYVDDAAMFLFTAQQVVRMRTALDAARPDLR